MKPDLRPHLWMPVPWSGCWEWMGRVNPRGDRARMSWRGKNHQAARVFYEYYRGPIPVGMFVCHYCDNGTCVNPAHLWVGTNDDNMKDMVRKGRYKFPARQFGEDHHQAKLTGENVRQIRARLATGETQVTLAAEFGVCFGTISQIKTGRIWHDFV